MTPYLIKTKEGNAFDPRLNLTIEYCPVFEDRDGMVHSNSVVIRDRKTRLVYLVSDFDTEEAAVQNRDELIGEVNRARKEAG